jgi:hypothetical protein
MNSFANRFSRNTTQEEDNFSDAAWGSQAGFGNIAMGVPTFSIPDVADVSDSYLIPFFLLISQKFIAHLLFTNAHR